MSRISLVREDRAKSIEDFLIQAARSGALGRGTSEDGRISENDLLEILKRIEPRDGVAAEPKIRFQRRSCDLDDDLDDEDDY